ncbi:DUF2946 domain-containing protein [Paralcaligenes ureilyticus]|uniref:DUF2946 family protein n=1 Tax=Paralcaligenes ureilyticus TaxID=627131 RepID=A0A4R3LYK6_9BURK|nr:DUF2946 domain-containing protein [Paralcaligenes ureilyticus]TCT05794.1 DUF2946 family protein [Paralcaligenes ureilyticus]
MPFCSHRKLTAWLGLIAIWLGLLMPIASQSMQRQEQALKLSFCFPEGKQNIHLITPDQSQSAHHAHDWKACGYCGLLALHLPLAHAAAPILDTPDRHIASSPPASLVVDLPLAHTPAFPRAPPPLFS